MKRDRGKAMFNDYMVKHFMARYGFDPNVTLAIARDLGRKHRAEVAQPGLESSSITSEQDFCDAAGIDRVTDLALSDDFDHGDVRVADWGEILQDEYATAFHAEK